MNPIAIVSLASAGVSLAQETFKVLTGASSALPNSSEKPKLSFDQTLNQQENVWSSELKTYLGDKKINNLEALNQEIGGLRQLLENAPGVRDWLSKSNGDVTLNASANGQLSFMDSEGKTLYFNAEPAFGLARSLHQLLGFREDVKMQTGHSWSFIINHAEFRDSVKLYSF